MLLLASSAQTGQRDGKGQAKVSGREGTSFESEETWRTNDLAPGPAADRSVAEAITIACRYRYFLDDLNATVPCA
jgi:hypothetical protein